MRDLLYTPRCAFCSADLIRPAVTHSRLCGACRETLTEEPRRRCARCAALLGPDAISDARCVNCQSRTYRLDAVVTLGKYTGPLRTAILRTKRPFGESLAVSLADLLYSAVETRFSKERLDALVPVPMHWTRRLFRGTNNAEVIAERLSVRYGVKMFRVLSRRRNTRPHRGLTPGERRLNVRGAFRVMAGYDFKAARLLLIDDIMTAGATGSEAAYVLKQAGAKWVGLAVAGRTDLDD